MVKLRKRGLAFTPVMILLTLVLLLMVTFVVISKQAKFGFKPIGDIQLNALETYQNAEKTLFLIDRAAKYAGYETIHELAESGGLYRVASDCGDYLEYPIWYNRKEECYPKDIKDEFNKTYNKNLNNMLKDVIVPESFVYVMLSENPIRIVGVSREMLKFPISYITEKSIGKELVCPLPDLVRTDTIGVLCTALHCELRPEVMERLKDAMMIAREKGFELHVTYAYRTIKEQIDLRARKGELAAKPSCTAPHVTGQAVDVVLKDQPYMTSGKYSTSRMDLGDRQILEDIMCEAGFVRYPREFWHYEYGTGRWQRGKAAGVCAII